MMTLFGRYCYYFHLADEKIEAQRGSAMCPGSQLTGMNLGWLILEAE